MGEIEDVQVDDMEVLISTCHGDICVSGIQSMALLEMKLSASVLQIPGFATYIDELWYFVLR